MIVRQPDKHELTKLKNGVQALIAKFSASHGKS